MNLLETFLLKLGDGRLDGRLQNVLPRALAALELANLPAPALEEARERLMQRLHGFQCCRRVQSCGVPDAEVMEDHEQSEEALDDEEGYQGQHVETTRGAVDVVEVESSDEEEEEAAGSQVRDEVWLDKPSFQEAEQAHDHGQLAEIGEEADQSTNALAPHFFQQMNEWTNMENNEKLAYLKQLQAATKAARFLPKLVHP